MQKYIFFSIVGLCIASAAALQLWLYSRLDGVCEDQMLGFAPSVAGGCLAGSFLSNMLWLLAKRRQWPVVEKLSLFVWVVIITGGLVAVGATLGQTQLYEEVCPAFVLANQIDVNLLQYVSVVLLILSIAAPHVYKKKSNQVAIELTPPLVANPLKPLNFL